MSIVEMQKIHILSLKNHKEGILKELQKSEVIDIQAIEEIEGESSSPFDLDLAEIKSVLSFLEGIQQKKRSFIESFIPPREEVTEEELLQTCREFDHQKFLENCKGIEGEISNLNSFKNEMEVEYDKLLPWKPLNFRLDELACSKKTCIITGKVKTSLFPRFKKDAHDRSTASDIVIVNQNKNETYLVLIYLASEKEGFTQFITQTDFESISLPISNKTPAEEIAKIEGLLKQVRVDIKEQTKKAKKLSPSIDQLKLIYDCLLEKKNNQKIEDKFKNTNYTFIIQGWIKKRAFEKTINKLKKVTDEFELVKIEGTEGEKPPVVLENPHALSPFELITNIYGTPKSDELDPTGPLSFFFALFFGLCLGDFGYGIILALISVYFLKRYKLPPGGIKLFQLLVFGGIVSSIVGLLTGSYLGFTPKDIPTLFPFLSSIQIIDPIKSPLVMLGFSLALGVVQLLFGICLRMYHNIISKRYSEAFLDDFLWLFFLSSLVFLIISSSVPLATVNIAKNLSIVGAVLMVLTQGRHKKNIIQKFLSGLLSLYKLSGYMGDILSYSRLLALGMSTTIIGSVINILAGMVKGGVPVLGVILMVVILIVGHLFNLIIGTLSAFVHSTRLQMVEFFSKFYEGGGREFRPFKRESEFTILKEV
jgi:V/A-type H+/Na+-transporting ATPase subunit I